MTEPYRVFVVVDRDHGQHLTELSEMGPVWIADTPANRSVAQQIWAAHPNRSHLEGVTTFKVAEGTSSEDMLINKLGTIDLHHGSTCDAQVSFSEPTVPWTTIPLRSSACSLSGTTNSAVPQSKQTSTSENTQTIGFLSPSNPRK